MKKSNTRLLAALTAAAMILGAAACSGGTEVKDHTLAPSETSDTAGSSGSEDSGFSTTTKAAASDTTTQETTASTTGTTTPEHTDIDPVPELPTEIRPGVWWAKSEFDGECYYSFNADGTGNLRYQDMGIGVGLNYSHDGSRYTFEMGGADIFNYAEVTFESNIECTLRWDDGRVEKLSYVSEDTEGFSFFSSLDLAECARWYYRDNHSGHEPDAADPLIADDESIEITLYDIVDGTRKILAVYYIDRYTAAGVDRGGSSVDLEPYTRTYGEGNAFDNRPDPDDLTGSFAPQLKVLNDEGALFGVWYLGYIDPEANDREIFGEYIRNILEYTGAASECNIYIDMDHSYFASTNDGTEFYLIIPRSYRDTVTVKEYFPVSEDNRALEGDTLYSGDGSAFLLKCNVSEIMPDVIVYITDEAGNTVSWSPGISGDTGHVLTYHPDGTIHDFTDYDKLAYPDLAPRG